MSFTSIRIKILSSCHLFNYASLNPKLFNSHSKSQIIKNKIKTFLSTPNKNTAHHILELEEIDATVMVPVDRRDHLLDSSDLIALRKP